MTMAKKKKVLPNADQQNLKINTTIYIPAREIANTISESIKHFKKLSHKQITALISEFINMKVVAIGKNIRYLALAKKMSCSGTVERW